MTFWNGNGPQTSMDFAMPDVCLVPGLVPIPTPFPNIANRSMVSPNQLKVTVNCLPTHNLMDKTIMSSGDEAGSMGGVISHTEMGPSSSAMGSTNVVICGAPVSKFGLPTKQNGTIPNAMGSTISPAQLKVMAMR